jgi:ribonuclease P protein component
MARFPQIPRLLARTEFLRAASAGKKAAQPGLVLQALAAPDAPLSVGFTVTKKVGNAVVRNRARRRLRAAADAVLREAPPPGWHLVLIGRAGTLDRPFPLLCADLRTALSRTGVSA